MGESTEWHRIVAFGAAAEVVRKLVRKGDPVLVEGRIASRSWTDKTGAERRATEIVVGGPRGLINVLAKRKKEAGGAGDTAAGAAAEAGDTAAEAVGEAGEAAVPAGLSGDDGDGHE